MLELLWQAGESVYILYATYTHTTLLEVARLQLSCSGTSCLGTLCSRNDKHKQQTVHTLL